jgi:hypothetical protein
LYRDANAAEVVRPAQEERVPAWVRETVPSGQRGPGALALAVAGEAAPVQEQLHALIHYLDDEVQRLLHGSFTGVVGDALFSAAAQATLLAAWMSYDSGLHGLAQRYFVQALSLAEAGNDRLLGASILDAMSHQATFLGRFTEAANLARAASAGPGASRRPR